MKSSAWVARSISTDTPVKNTPLLLAILAAALVLGGLSWLAARSQRTLERGLPPRIVCASLPAAAAEAAAWQRQHGGTLLPILGTGSMQPYIPAAPAGADPRATIVAYAVTAAGATYHDIAPGALCTYRPTFDASGHYIHGAAERDRHGWIMSGLNNERSESWARVTPQNFTGLVAIVFVGPAASGGSLEF